MIAWNKCSLAIKILIYGIQLVKCHRPPKLSVTVYWSCLVNVLHVYISANSTVKRIMRKSHICQAQLKTLISLVISVIYSWRWFYTLVLLEYVVPYGVLLATWVVDFKNVFVPHVSSTHKEKSLDGAIDQKIDCFSFLSNSDQSRLCDHS